MGVTKLSKVSVIVPRSEVPFVLRELSEFGMFHPSQPHSEKYDPKLDDLSSRAFRTYIALGEIVRDASLKLEPGILDILAKGYHISKEKFTVSDWEDLVNRVEADAKPLIDEIGRALGIANEAEKTFSSDKALREALRLVSGFSIDFKQFAALKRVRIIFAVVTAKDLREVKKSLPEAIVVDAPLTKAESAVVIAAPKSSGEFVEKVLRSFEVEPFSIPPDLPQNPTEAFKVVDARVSETEKKLTESKQRLAETVKNNENRILAFYEISKTAHSVLDEMKRLGDLKRMAVLQGYIPHAREPQFKESFGKWITVAEEVHPVAVHGHGGEHEQSDVPTLMSNPGFMKSFEVITMNQGAPRYGEIDPTAIIGLIFPIFYGIMFGDLGHGSVMLLFGVLLLARKAPSLKSWGRVLALAGLSSAVVGLLIGEAFGLEIKVFIPPLGQFTLVELVERFHEGQPLAIPTINIVALKLMLKISILLGMAHLATGHLVGIANDIRNKANAELIAERLPTFAMYIGFIFLFFAFLGARFQISALFSDYSRATPLFFFLQGPPVAVSGTIAVALLAGPLALYVIAKPAFIVMGKFPRESVGMAAMQNLIEGVFEKIPSFLSNTVSYTRLAVLLTVHASLLIALNLAWKMPFGSGIPLIIISNILIIALEGLIVYIQDLRLHLYEWFTKFYGGTGIMFRRLTSESVRSEIEWKD